MFYTKCPACGAALGFEPQNEGDDACKLKCPACGKTMRVKPNLYASSQAAENTADESCASPAQAEEETKRVSSEPQEETASKDEPQDEPEVEAQKKSASKRKSVAAILKNIVCAAFSLAFIGLSVACYFSIKGAFAGGNEFNSFYNGIYLWELVFTYPEYFAASFGANASWGFAELLPMILFTLACIDVIVCVAGICLKRYGKTYHLILGAAVCAMSVALMFVPYVNILNVDAAIGVENDLTISQYFTSIFNPQYTMLYFAPIIGVVRFVCAILFALRFSRRKKEM